MRFLRRHYPDQVRGSRARLPSSQPGNTKLPVQMFTRGAILLRVAVYKLSITKVEGVVKLTHATLPLFFELKLARADSRAKGEEIDQQAIELAWFVQHRKMTRLFE
jgi:hypothetical protein